MTAGLHADGRRAVWLAMLGFVVMIVAGCTGAPDPVDDDAREVKDSIEIPWGLGSCRFVAFTVSVDAGRLEPYVPDGFTLRAQVDAGGVQRVGLGLEAFECESVEGLNDSEAPGDYGSYWVSVDAEERFLIDEVESYYVKWDTLVQDEPRRVVLADEGLPVRDGQAAVDWIDQPGGERIVEASLDMGVGGGFELTATGTSTEGTGFPFVEYMPTEGGRLAAWRGVTQDMLDEASGPGFVTLTPGSWVADVVGATQAPVQGVVSGVWTFTNATVTMVEVDS